MALAVLGDVAILIGLDAAKPSDNATGSNGTQGRIYFATDTGKTYRDNGTSWDEVHAIDSMTAAALAAHLADTTAAHAASAIGFTPAGAIAATDAQAAIVELDTEKQPLDSDLTAIAALAPTNDDVMQRKAGAWANRTIAQLIADIIAAGAWTEAVQDVIGAMVAAAGGSYNDGANTITLPTGFANPMTTQDDIIIGAASGTPDRLAKGTDGQVLTVDPTTHHLIWATPSGGGAALTVEEVDGTPTDSAITKIVFPNGTLAIVSHVATYTPSGGGGGGGQELGYAAITAQVTTTSTSFADVTGLSVAVTIGSRPVKITVFCPLFDSNGGSAVRMQAQIYDVTAGAAIALAFHSAPATNGSAFTFHARHAPAAGSRTYKVQFKTENGAVTSRWYADASGGTSFILVEEI
jgi:hypothetical protein